jgi:hypothetical protein
LLLVGTARSDEEPAECPKGTHRMLTNNPYEPFKCVKEDVKKGFSAVTGPKGFKARPKCPRGTRATASTDALQTYRCVRVMAGETDPDLAPIASDEELPPLESGQDDDPLGRGCPPGKRKVRTADPLRPYQCVTQATRMARLSEESYRRYSVPAELSFDYPRMLQPRDGWKEDVPTLSFTLDDGKPGKPVMITITKIESAQPTFIDIDEAVTKDKEWQNANDGGHVPVAGVRARITFVAGESKTAYVPLSRDAYYTVVYSAPVESYEAYLAAFNRLLKTMKIVRSEK